MRTPKKTLSTLLILSMTGVFTTALADDGVYVGAHIQSSTLSHTIERDTGEAMNASITSYAEQADAAIGISLGYKFHLSEDMFMATEIFYTAENAETTNINNMLQTIIGLDSTYGLNLKAGFDITDKFSVFGIVGYTTLEFDIDNSYPFAPPMRSGSDKEADISIGFGAQYNLNMSWAINAEYIRISDVDFTPLPEVAVPGKINPNELSYNNLTLGLNYSF